ncbi:MAG: hypothetical protein IPM60_06435 [Rhodospirillales bacterium]|nr:hypothetical protein [Rhodospirillales bacterium]
MTDVEPDAAPKRHSVREAVGVFHDANALEAAIDELLDSGFERAEISLLASDKSVEDKLGHAYRKVTELEDDTGAPRVAYVDRDSVVEGKTGVIGGLAYVGALAAAGAVVASGGTLAAVLAAAVGAGGAGGLLGTFAARWIGREHAKTMQSQLDKGGLLLWVHIRDEDHERRAVDILSRHSADDVHVHDLPAQVEPEGDPLSNWQPDPFLPSAKV